MKQLRDAVKQLRDAVKQLRDAVKQLRDAKLVSRTEPSRVVRLTAS